MQFRLITLFWLIPLVASGCVFAKVANSPNNSSFSRHATGLIAAWFAGLAIHRLAFAWRTPARGSAVRLCPLILGFGLYFLALSRGGSIGSLFAMAAAVAALLEVFRER